MIARTSTIIIFLLFSWYPLYATDTTMDTIQYLIADDLSKRTGFDVEITNMRIVKGQDILNNGQPKILKKVQMDRFSGKNKAQYVAILDDKMQGLTHILFDVAFDQSVEVFVTSRHLQKGVTINPEDFYPVKQKMSRILPGTITSKDKIQGKITQIALGQGVVLRESHVSDTITIKRGQKVNVTLEIDNVVLSTQGTLKADAALGGIARVYCETTKKEIQGLLVSQGQVRVRL
ncbi:MAG: flagellar basal body P-ring formation chaperone FlgA [Thermodesulfovibrionales bacterium]|nr:flagellar basal body P-ring formation chaperone FlgA [Thermodesulfovibrionales bacterium]